MHGREEGHGNNIKQWRISQCVRSAEDRGKETVSQVMVANDQSGSVENNKKYMFTYICGRCGLDGFLYIRRSSALNAVVKLSAFVNQHLYIDDF